MNRFWTWLKQPRQVSTVAGVAVLAGTAVAAYLGVMSWPVAIPVLVSGGVAVVMQDKTTSVLPLASKVAGDIAQGVAKGGAVGGVVGGLQDLPDVIQAVAKANPKQTVTVTQTSVSTSIAEQAATAAQNTLTADQLNAAELASKSSK
jgi:hypothetical protein